MAQGQGGGVKLGTRQRADLAWILKQMHASKVFNLKLGDWEIQLSQYAFAPAAHVALPAQVPTARRVEEMPAAIAGPFAAFRPPKPWEKPPAAGELTTEPVDDERPNDPTDPDSPIDDDRLFGMDLRQEH
jgi:hypothetical protein